jgi:Sensors of blue-light using FAD
MFHIVYASSASQAFTKSDLQTLLQEIRPKNADLGITGMLLYKDGNFMQALEGEEEVLTRLVRIIQHDSRHKGLLVLLRGSSEQRLFPDWSMGFRDLADERTVQMPGYSDFMNTSLTDAEFSRDPNRCMKLLMLFKKKM